MAGCRRVGAVTFAVLVSFLIGQIDAQGDFPGLGSLPNELGIGAGPVDLVFIVDTSQFTNTSESLDEEIAVKAFLTSFLDSADINSGMVKVGFVTYSTHPNVVFDLDTYSSFNEMVDAIFTADFNPGERNTADALGRVRSKVLVRDRKDAPNVVLLLQTGKSDRNDYRTVQEAEGLKYARANIFVVGYNLDAEAEEEVNDIASKPTRENTFIMDSAFELDLVKEIVFAQIFTRAEQSRNSAAAASETLDVAFLIHFSNTLTRDAYQRLIEFMKSIVQYSAIDDDNVRVGAVVFRKRGVLLFDFNSYYTKDEVLSGIDQINYNYRAKSVSIAAGFDTVRSSLFVDSAGERRDVPNLVVFITDANADTDMSETIQSAEKLKAAGTAIYTVGINVTYPDELLGLASSPDYTLIVNDTQYLEQQVFRLRDAFVALRTEEMPLEVPGLESTTAYYETTTTTAPTTTTVHNSESADIVFLIHASKKTKSKLFKRFMLKYIKGLAMRPDHTKTKFAVVTYGMQAETIFNLQLFKTKKHIKRAIKKVPKDKRYKTANLTEALRYVRDSVLTADNGDEANNPNGIILFSDQASTTFNGDELKTVADSLKGDGIGLFAIGIGTDPTLQTEIETVTGDTNATDSFMVNDYSELLESRELTKKIASSFKPFYLEELDVVLALHVSHNVKLNDVKKQLFLFLNDLISSVDIESGAVRVSVVVYGLDAKVQFDFDKYSKPKKLLKAIKKIRKSKSVKTKGSDIVKLLNVVQTDVLVEKKGDRADVPNLLILFTDSTSSSQITDIIQESAAMKRAGTTMFAIGVKDADIMEIETVASDPAGEYSFIGKSYGDFSTSINLREKLKSIKIFENMKMPKSGKTTDKKKPKPTKPPKASTLYPRPTNRPSTVTIVQHTRPQPTTTYRSRQLTTLPTDWANTMSTATPTTTYLSRVVFEGEATTQMTKVATPTTTSPITEYTVSPPAIPTLPLAESNKADIVLAVHLSPRATPFDFGAVQQFLKSLIADADVVNNSVQIGLMFYAADPEVIFHINQYHDLSLMVKAIDGLNVDLRSFRTDASGALGLGRQMLSTYFNRRNDVPSALIFITDEPSNKNIDLLVESKDAAVFEGIEIFAIGVGMHDKIEVEALATSPDNVMMVQRYGQLSDAAEALQDKISAFGKPKKSVEEKVEKESTTTAETPAGPMATVPVRTEEPALYITLAPFLSVEPAKCQLGNSDLVIIIDASTSVTEVNFKKQLQFTKDLLKNADIDSGTVRVGILIYSTDVKIQFHLNKYQSKYDINAAIDRIPYIYGSTNTADALSTMHHTMFTATNGDRPDVPNTCIVITDGVSNINGRKTIPNAEAARAANIHIYAVGIGITETRELNGIATVPARDNVFSVQNFEELKGLDQKIFSTLCPVAVEPTKPPQPTCGLSTVDLVIIIDASTSVTESNFQKMREFCKDLVDYADVDSGSVRVGVLIYSTEVEIQFHLNKYKTTDDIKAAIDRIPYIYGSTNTADSLETMHDVMFTSSNGDRAGVDNVGVILTDGISNINSRRTIPEAVTARKKGIVIYAIGIGLTDTREVDGIASTPTDQYSYNVQEFDELVGLSATIFGGGDGSTDCGKPVNVTTTTAAPEPKAECGLSKVDVVIILDASTSVTKPNFLKMLTFAKDIVDKADVDSGSVRIAALIYSTEVEIQFYLNQYKTGDEIKAAIDEIPYIYGSTNSADALKTMHQTLFNQASGDRPDVDNIAFMITDGISNINGRRTIPEAEAARAKGIRVYAIGIGLDDTRELEGMASEPSEDNTFNVKEFDELGGLVVTIFGGTDSEACAPNEPPVANAGSDVSIQMPIDFVTLDGRKSTDDAEVVMYQWIQVSGSTNIVTQGDDNAVLELSRLNAGVYVFALTVFDVDGQSDDDEVQVTVKERDFPPTADAGDDVTLQAPANRVTLNGSGSRDDVEIVQYLWVLVSGDDEGSLTLDGVNKQKVNVRGLKAGTYQFELTVLDALGQSDTDTVDILVTAAEIPPVARAGDDITIKLPTNNVTLDGSHSSDDVGVVRYRWRLRSGDKSGVVLDGEKSRILELTELKPGNYRFSLTVIDGQKLKHTDYVEVTVLPDDPPVANAGKDITVQLPVDIVSVRGDMSTDDVGIVTYVWTLLSGDSSVIMDRTDEANIDLYGLTAGTYTFELLVTDASKYRDTDTMTLVVLPEPTLAPSTEAPCGLDKTDLIFVVDASTSVTEKNFKKQLEFMKSVIRFADVNSGSVRFGALIYSTEVEIQFHLNEYTTEDDIIAAVDRIPYIYGSTNTADGLAMMRDTMFSFRNGDRDDAPNVAMVITDGVSNINGRKTIPQAEDSRDVGIHIFAVGIGLTDTRELNAIASEPFTENAFAVADFDELSGLGPKIFSATCIEVTTTTTTTTTTSTTTTTTAPPTTSPSCGLSKTDLVFILDASTSVTEKNFQKMREFLKDFLGNADIDSGSVRVGINIYSTEVQIMFHLNEYKTEAEVLAAIDEIPYIYGSTNTADALKVMTSQMFLPERGDRPDAPNVCVLLTDGISNINSRRTIPEAEDTRRAGIHVYVIGIGLKDTREVEGIATPPIAHNLFAVQDFDELVGLKQKMFSSVCPDEEDLPPTANAGKDMAIRLPDDIILLSGENSTDDIEIITYVWSQVSGPRVNVIQSDNSFLELTDLKEGTYVIELQVSDGKGQVDTDTVTITVLPEPDLPPIADAGADKRIQLPTDNVVLRGIDSTDDKGIVDFYWELTSPNDWSVRLWGENSMTLNVDNLQEGEYVFTLTVKDKKGQTDSDIAVVKVIAAPDLPPIANAGRDYDIQLPTDTVTLDGSRSTDDIGIVAYQWTLISGESRRLRLYGKDSQSVTLDGLKEGEYVLSLVVSDKKGQTSSDEARITVKRAPRVSGWDVIFILDSSVSPSKFRWMNNYARNVIREMSIDDGEFRVGYLIYSNGAYRQFDLNAHDNKADVMAAIDKVGYRPGDKNTASAFKFARKRMFTPENGDRAYAKNYVVHLTGGDPSMNPFQAATEACQLQNNGAGMFAVGFGEVPDLTELDAYSSVPTDDYELLIRAESEMGETPGLMLYQLKRGSPSPSRCPEKATTPRPKGPFKCTSSGDIIFILDSSGSVGQDNFYRVLNFTYSTIAGLDVDSGQFRVGVTTFSDTSRLDFNLNEFSTRNEIEKALTQVVYMYGNTHTAHALRRVRNEMFTMQAGDRSDIPNVIVIITDGQSNVNHELTIPEARALKADGVTIVTVAVGFTSETSELIGLTSPPISENLIYVADYESLDRLKEQLIEPLCTDSNMCRSKPCQNGGVCMDGIRSFVCLCPDDYFGETCSKRCGDPADVVIVLDSSNTVGAYNFARLKEYAEHLVREMNKDSCDINLGFLTYSSAAMVQVYLGMHTDTETNIRAIEQISYTRGRANMAAAFRALRTEMYNGRRGDRTGARNIVYFLTDGTNDVHAEMTEPEAELTISAGIRIIPIGINLRERFELDNIAQNQGITVIEINDEPGLIENTDIILRPLYEGNDFCGESPCANGGTCVNEPFGFRCDCPVGFTGETCQRRCKAKGDVVFVVDTSRFVTRKELKNVRRFLRSIVKRMKFKRNQFSVGMVQFTDWAKVTLDFDSGKSKKAVRSSIAGLRVHGGDPEPAVALAKANFRIFNGRGASRDKPDYLILLTKSMRQEQDILSEANKLKMQGTRIIGVGLGLTKSEQEYMESTVSMPYRETAMFTNNAKELGDISDRIVEYMCDGEDLCAENPCRNGGSCERLGGDFYCSCAVGYAGKFCENKCQARADIVFLLDSSGSVGHVDFRRVKQFVHNMVSDLQIGTDKTRVGLVTYSSHSRHGFFMSKYYTLYELQNAIAGISYEYGNSNAAEGLRLVRERYFGGTNGDRVEIQNFLVIVTDGVSNVQPDQTIIEAQLLKDQGVHVYAVGIGEFDPHEINSIASEPSRMNAYMLKDYSALDNISSSIVKATCRDPTVCDENPCRNGGLCVPGINGAFCECRAGYRGEHCQDSCVSVKDIFFLLDSSDSVGSANFESALNFITSLVEEFSGKGSYNRFSLITYSTDVQIVFSLGRYTRLPVIQNAVKYARYRPGNTNLVGAFRTANEISVHVLGDRYDAENIIFVIADGDGNVDERETVQAAQDLKDKGARIIPIAVNMNDHSEMEQIASNKTDVFQVDTFSKLQDELDDIIATTCKNSNTVHDGK